MFKWRKGERRSAAEAESVDVAARLHPYEELFNEAMAMAARFADDRARRDRRRGRPENAVLPARAFGRRAS